MKLGLISGSNRKDSFNTKVLEYIESKFQEEAEMEFIDISKIPIYNQDIETDPIESVSSLRESLRDLDGIILISPEHNGAIPAVLKNFLDWMSRVEQSLKDKPTMVLTGSISSRGGESAMENLKAIMSSPYVGNKIIEGTSLSIPEVHSLFNSEGEIINKEIEEKLDKSMEIFFKALK